MRKEFLLPFFVVVLTGCSALNIDPQAQCAPGAGYSGPSPRAAVTADSLPRDRLDTHKSMPSGLVRTLDAEFKEMFPLLEGATAASVSIWSPEHGYWSNTVDMDPGRTNRFWAASISKMVVGTIILEMVEEGRIDLSTPVSNWLPSYRDAHLITVEQLLNHTSGIFSFDTDKKQQGNNAYQSPEELLATATRHPLNFCPGTNWYYSNTGYVMLGLIAEAVDGQSLSEIIDHRIAKPLKLDSFALVTPGDAPDSLVQTANTGGADVKGIATLFGAGGIATNSEDLLTFLHSYLTGDVISDTSLALAFSKLYPMFGGPMSYGLGIMTIDVSEPGNATVWLGHSGGSPDVKAIAYYDVKRATYITVMVNKQAPAEALANRLLKVLDRAK